MISCSIPYKKFNFPVGEMHIKVKPQSEQKTFDSRVQIVFDFEKNEEIIELMLLCDALKSEGYSLLWLFMSYVPFSRQDRINEAGESFSLKTFCNIINSLGFQTVQIDDPHSDVTTALLNNVVVVEQKDFFVKHLKDKENFWLICPDGGALKKIYKLAKEVNSLGVIECSKIRNTKTGEITGVVVHEPASWAGADAYIVDDIVDAGRTFIEIAKAIRHNTEFVGSLNLMITHGFFTHKDGIAVFDHLIQHIYTKKGQLR